MQTKRGTVEIRPGKPLFFSNEEDVPGLTDQVNNVGAALKAYRRAAAELLQGKYSHLSSIAPTNLRQAGNIFVAHCSDGIFVRYDDSEGEQPKVRVAELDDTLANVALQFSEQVIYLDKDPFYPESAPKITLGVAGK